MLLQTENFKLATYAQGDEDAARLAIVAPGRLDTKDYAHIVSHVDHLAQLGYYAISFDGPGTWESPGKIEEYTTTNILRATHEIIQHFHNRPTALIGHSRGGSIAMLAAAENTNVSHLVAIMSYAGPTNVGVPADRNSATIEVRDLPPGTARSAAQRRFELPYSYFADQQQYDPLTALGVFDKPKLFFYGTQDELVTEEDVLEGYHAAAAPKDMYALHAPHDYRLYPEVIDEVNLAIGAFLERTGG